MTSANGNTPGDVEARAAREAAAAFERLLDEVDGPSAPRPRIEGALDRLERAGLDAGGDAIYEVRAAVMRTTQLYLELLQRTADEYLAALEGLVRLGAATLSADRPNAGGLALSARPGDTASAPVFIHNTTDRAVLGVALRLTDLTAADGCRIASATAAFSPTALDLPPAQTGRALVSVAVPRAVASGTYHGHVLLAGLADASLPVRLAVEPAGGENRADAA